MYYHLIHQRVKRSNCNYYIGHSQKIWMHYNSWRPLNIILRFILVKWTFWHH